MPWIKMPGIEGLVYEPQQQPSIDRKHNCQDCYFCQNCSDVKCTVCMECGDPPSTSESRNRKSGKKGEYETFN